MRRVVTVPGRRSNKSPIPHAVVLGNLILPSVISGLDPSKDDGEPEPEEQILLAFANLRSIIEAAGGTTDSIGKITIYLKDFKHRRFVDTEWVRMFPDENNRPARHVIQHDLQSGTYIQMDVIGWLDDDDGIHRGGNVG